MNRMDESDGIEVWFEPMTMEEFERAAEAIRRMERDLERNQAMLQDMKYILTVAIVIIVGLACIIGAQLFV